MHLRCTSVLLMQSKIVIKLCIFIYEPWNGVVYNFKFYVFWYGFVLFQGLLEQLLCLSAQAFLGVEFQVVRAVDDFVQGVEGILEVFRNKAKAADDCDLLERFGVVEGSVKFQSLLFRDHPTLPGDPLNSFNEFPSFASKDTALLLPLTHCAFKGCSWCWQDAES